MIVRTMCGWIVFLLFFGTTVATAQKTLKLEGEDYSFSPLSRSRQVNEDFGYFLSNSRWPSEPDGRTIVFVCWANPSPLFAKEMTLVRDSVSDSWQKHSRLEFRGWQPCAKNNSGIKIAIKDSGPHVKGLGNKLDRMDGGMELNFTFQNWGQSCSSDASKRDSCISSIAVHEFGHAIGFAHEHNRWDKPGECQEAAQGSSGDLMLTPYDKNSVMNYCNTTYNNNGVLSALDVISVQQIYGKPQ